MKEKPLQFTIITGLSGAGRSEAVKCFEDMGYFCIDNLPPTFISQLADLCSLPGSKIHQLAVVSDVRGGEFFDHLFESLKELKNKEIDYQIIFLEASNDVLVKRFKETRRKHPLSKGGRVIEGIKEERKIMGQLRGAADIIIDTSELEAYQLRDELRSTILAEQKQKGLLITVISFGYKYGVPIDADLVMDVRFLPNPHYVERLRALDGQDRKVVNFIMRREETKSFLKDFTSLLSFLLPRYISEGKTHLTLAIGCTGGTHRSVTFADKISKFLGNEGYNVMVRHRDIDKKEVT